MIDLYSFPTLNGHKVSIMLEECGLPHRAHKIDITKGEQFDPDFRHRAEQSYPRDCGC